MPATTHTKAETKAATDLGDAAKQCLNGLEKKVRNLEKRKGRIEQNQEKARKGVKLEKEQEDSLQQYDQVMHCLEFARELHKQFLQINQEHEKVARKQAKREKAERQALEIKRICEILQLQALLDLLGRDNVREDFKTGNHGAVVLSEDNLNQLDELYQAISPSRDDSGDEYPQRITQAAEHLVNYLDAKDRQVVGTTYKELRELITLIMQCGYFEKPKTEEVLEAATTESPEEADVATADVEEAVSDELASSNEPDQTSEEPQQPPPPVDLTTAVEVTQSHRVLTTPALDTLEQDAFFAPSSLPYQSAAEPHFTQSSHAAAPHIPDYPSFSNGPFQFIQASYVMPETTGIVDPAVIVAQPAVSSGLQFMSQSFDSQPLVATQPQLHLQHQNQAVSSMGDLTQIQSSGNQQPQQLAPDYNSQSYAQNLPTDSLFTVQSVSEVADKLSSHPSMLAQMREDGSASSFEIPPSIPLPPSQVQSEASSEQQQHLQETQFQMNARAPVFQSMYSQMAGGAPVSAAVAGSQASVMVGSEGHIPSAVDFSKSSPTGEFGQPGAGDFQQSSKGGTYQGYPANNNYKPDSFQGAAYNYNKNRYSGEVYQKRGGAMGSPGGRGFPRGGAGVNNSRGGMRGGMARGGSSGPRGGYNRPLATQ